MISRASLGALAGSLVHKWPRTEATEALYMLQTSSIDRGMPPALFLVSLDSASHCTLVIYRLPDSFNSIAV